MRLLHIYGGNRYGGVERLLATLAQRRVEAADVEQRFGLCFRGQLRQELEAAGAAVADLGAVRVSRPWQVARARRRLRRLAAQAPPDLALCHAWWSYAIFAPALRRARVPVGLWVHNRVTGRGWLEAWARRRRPEFAITWGTTMAESLQTMFPGLRTEIWRPPVEPPPPLGASERRRIRHELGTEEHTPVILQASRLEAWKGQGLLLEALARLDRARPWTAWIAGGAQTAEEARFAAELRTQAQALGVAGRVRWLGWRRDMGTLMRSAEIFCQPNTSPEPYGLVFVEALAAGLPVVATAGGGASEIVTADCGSLTAARPEGVAAALETLIEDEPRRRRMAEAAPARAAALCDPARQMRAFPALMMRAGGRAV
jgi:glycosyltransferase involved in cell wall biosynthesis